MLEKVKKESETYYFSKEIPEIDDIKKMEYYDCISKETLRHFSPLPSTEIRLAKEDHTVGDIKIRKGDYVTANVFYNWFNPKYFEDPEKYNPDRWLDGKGQGDPYAFSPFWAGPRNCIG